MNEPTDLPWSMENTLEADHDKRESALPEQYGSELLNKAQNPFTIPGPVTRPYESLPPSMSASQIFEVASNDGSTMGSSTFNDSSASSSRLGTRQDSFSDIQSRKASMSSTYDSTSSIAPERSPEVLYSARGSWYPADEKMNFNHQLPHNRHFSNISSQDMPSSTPFLPSEYAMTSQLQDSHLRASTSSTQLLHSRSYSATAYFENSADLPKSSSSASSLASKQPLPFPQPQSSNADGEKLNSGDKSDTLPTARGRSNTSGSTRRLKFSRSRTGCMVCRKRKVKCDQDGLPCKQCRIGKRECHYDDNPPKRRRKGKKDEKVIDDRTTSTDSTDMNRTSQANEASWDDQMLSPNSALTLSNLRADMEVAPTEQPMTQTMNSANYADVADLVREEDEELRRKTDALFAQHTNIDDVGTEESQMGTGECVGSNLNSYGGQAFGDIDDTRLNDSILSHTSMGSASLSGTISDQTMDSSFESSFIHLSSQSASSIQVDLKHREADTSSTFASFSAFGHDDDGGDGAGTGHW